MDDFYFELLDNVNGSDFLVMDLLIYEEALLFVIDCFLFGGESNSLISFEGS